MKLSTRGRYAVMAMVDLAAHSGTGPVTLAVIAQRQGISRAYLEQLFGHLRRHSLIESVRGPTGGYILSKLADDILIVEIVTAVDEPLQVTRCQGKSGCSHDKSRCATHDLWAALTKQIYQFFANISLSDVLMRRFVQPQDFIKANIQIADIANTNSKAARQ